MKVIEGGVTAAKGYKAAGLRAGIKAGKTNKDMAMIYSEKEAVCAGTFTKNVVKAAPVFWDKDVVYKEGKAQAVVVNSGIANACTGEEGLSNCKKEAEKAGVDGLLLVTPYYNKATQNGLKAHYKAIASQVKVPIILYNVPSRTGTRIQPQTIVDLCREVPNIVAVKDATGDISEVAELMHLADGDVDVYSGNDDQIVPILSLGGKGVISVLSNVLPQETHDIVASYLEGDVKKSCELQVKYIPLIKALFSEVNPIPVKKAMNLMGMEVGSLRLPLTEMEEEHAKKLAEEMKKAGITLK